MEVTLFKPPLNVLSFISQAHYLDKVVKGMAFLLQCILLSTHCNSCQHAETHTACSFSAVTDSNTSSCPKGSISLGCNWSMNSGHEGVFRMFCNLCRVSPIPVNESCHLGFEHVSKHLCDGLAFNKGPESFWTF